MSLRGNLGDVGLPDVLQFIHLGERSGTLQLRSPRGERAEVAFHRGRIINAHGPGTRRVGDLLLDRGEIDAAALEEAVAEQRRDPAAPPLGRLLIAMGKVSPEAVRRAVEQQIEQVLYGLFTWTRAEFEFVLDEVRPCDDLALAPGDVLPDFHLDTQLLLLEAARLFDERRATSAGPKATPPTPPPRVVERPRARARLQVVSADLGLVSSLERGLKHEGVIVVRVTVRDAGLALPGESAPRVLVDLRSGSGFSLETVSSLRRARPRACVIALPDPGADLAALYAAGIAAPVDACDKTILACLRSLRALEADHTADQMISEGLRAGFAKLRRVFGEFRSGLLSATVSLNLMNVISESVERAVFFLVRRGDLLALGAFGDAHDGRALAERTRGLKLEIDQAGVLREGLTDAKPRRMRYADAPLPPALMALLGPPASGECAVFPVLGGERVIATIYADNGRQLRSIDELEFLELATAQVGIAYENELLRRRAAQPGGGA
jgi:hypothetical protein